MSARILDGTAVAGQIRSELSSRAAAFTRRAGRQPGLSIVLVGDKPDSQIYVNSKLKSAGDEGMTATLSHLPASTSLDEILSLIDTLNADPATDGILVQAPLPDSLGASAMQKVFDAIDPSKDVDGVTPAECRAPGAESRRPDCMHAGRHHRAAAPQQHRNRRQACGGHRPQRYRRQAGIDAAAAPPCHRDDLSFPHAGSRRNCRDRRHPRRGARPARLRAAAFVRPGATVIDVGINLVTDASVAREIFHEGHPRRGLFERKGSVLVGDVHPDVAEVAGALTPVPGGVGPLTIAMLMANTIKAAELRLAAGDGRGPACSRLSRVMLKVALTGGIATGKSYVLARLKDRGIPTIDADDIVHDALGPGTATASAIATQFGRVFLKPDGSIDRTLLARRVFSDPETRLQLEAIVHPVVYDAIRSWFETARSAHGQWRQFRCCTRRAANMTSMSSSSRSARRTCSFSDCSIAACQKRRRISGSRRRCRQTRRRRAETS